MENFDDKNTQLFLYLISSFELAGMQNMGKIKNPLTDKIEKDLHQAQFFIDLLDMIKIKTKGNLTSDEQKFLENVLGQLKLNYLDELDKENKEKVDNEKKQSEETKADYKMTFGIRGNTTRSELPAIAFELIKVLEQKRINYLIDKKLCTLIGQKYKKEFPKKYQADNGKLVKNSDFLVSIGGDGTFLSSAKLVGDSNIPIIGVNLGKLGFLAETSVEKMSHFISDILKKKFKIEERTVVQASSKKVNSKNIFGLNEIVIHQSGTVRTIEIQAYFNNQLVISYLADGLIVSTPTGSTGYALSSGGPIVNPNSNVIVLAPMYPHTLTARHVILPDNGYITIKVFSKIPIIVTSDGNNSFKLKSPAEIDIKKAHYTIKIAKPPDSNYFKVLNEKLLWGEDVRKNQKQ